MAVKFSAFTTRTGTLDASTKIVGYDDPAGTKTNVEFSLATLAANSGIYVTDGTIGTTRIAKVTDTVTFQNVGGTSSLFSLNTDGTFTLGLGAAATLPTQVAIGEGATTVNNNDIAIGKNSSASGGSSIALGASANAGANGIAIGSATAGANGISMGQSSVATGTGVAIGLDAKAPASSIGLGAWAKGTGANSITLNANGSIAAPSTANAFGVYMTSNAYPDFSVTSNVTKFAFDADSFATITVADSSNTTITTGETGTITFADSAGDLATIATLRTESFIVACSDETTVLATGANPVATFRMPYAFTLTAVRASLTTAGTTSGLTTIDINLGGSSIFTTDLLTIDFGDKTSVGATTPPNITTTALTSDGEITIDIDAISGGATETGLKVTLIGYQTV